MNADNFIKELTDLIDTEKELTLDTALNEIEEWDSVSMVSFFSFCSINFPNVKVLPEQIKTAKTVKDLYAIIEEK